VAVNINRDGFTLNPTSCNPMEVGSTITGTGGAIAHPSSRFQVASCESLGFAPKLALNLKGATKRAKDPALKAVLTAPAGQANIGKVQVILPKSVFIDQSPLARGARLGRMGLRDPEPEARRAGDPAGNLASQRVAARLGAEYEGLRRGSHEAGGRRWDMSIYSLRGPG
jgi:hypothetical protein